MQKLANILVKRLPNEQINEILQEISNRYDYGHCPICDAEDYPVDADGNEIEGDDVSHAEEWREQHYEDCIVTLIEAARLKKPE